MGVILHATVLIYVERRLRRQPAADAMGTVAWHVARLLGPDEQLSIAAVTASELLHGVRRADEEHRPRREAFVEAALDFLPTIPFDLRTARIHSQLD